MIIKRADDCDFGQAHYHLDAESFYLLVQKQVPEEHLSQVMCNYFMNTKHPYSMCVGLEYLYMNDYMAELYQLIEKNRAHSNKLNQDWALVYKLMLLHEINKINKKNLLNQLHAVKTTDPALQCVILFQEHSIFTYTYESTLASNLISQYRQLFNQINNYSILRPYIENRLDRVLFIHYWKSNDIILARKHAYKVLSMSHNKTSKTIIHINLASTFIFDSFNSAKYHLNTAQKIVFETKNEFLIKLLIMQNIPFIHAHFGIVDDIKTENKSEQAHLALAKGNNALAKKILAGIKPITPFTKYYLGRAYNDKRMLMQSYNDFIEKNGDFFYARLPFKYINMEGG
ncbi:hypothetical protein SAMN04488134_103268 [Amphibacillus marinus]|uniref:Uncharacterized protein n=1 Tax=Amphibacillus marinus TaxID=872970 RepID=A0A1H8LN62_9BACI|nr:AimR family lysis-lysogeny pheromone receptor [Amphibacillus marinus]SEO06591.1 hypothetical protein SAMN04488134_103268 [Amphibacillus marinus]